MLCWSEKNPLRTIVSKSQPTRPNLLTFKFQKERGRKQDLHSSEKKKLHWGLWESQSEQIFAMLWIRINTLSKRTSGNSIRSHSNGTSTNQSLTYLVLSRLNKKKTKMNSKLLALFVVVVLMAVSSYAATLDVPFEYEVDSTSEYLKKNIFKILN